MEKNISVFCSTNDNPNGVTTSDLYMGETVSRGGRFCDMRQFDVPFRHEFKLSGSYPLPYERRFRGGAAELSRGRSGRSRGTPAASLFPGGRTNSETIRADRRRAQLYQPRYNQLDINFKKNFRSGSKRFSLQLDLFNVLNDNAIFGDQRRDRGVAGPGARRS